MSGGFLDDTNFTDSRPQESDQLLITDFLFVSFNSRVLALDRDTGKLLWSWKAPKGRSNYVSILVDDEQLFASIDGYTYCLDPYTGRQIWFNALKGFGYGIPTLATADLHTNNASAAEIISREQRRQDNGAQ
ncbi:Outer membrane protein assembly factor BamB [Gimesia alba]|uniref:Outer membrane protein assembly factor BamB n=1 Tax=Gimesia alba TaxID=2527973 RepID=A0A517RME8_9PLAN|nr:PQQ-binding-like beta-propeller repeat protein [Gimesia alba]QDT45058.1 Outer membrane protein assembly factor BamB [Gimesia alba]